MNRIIRKSQNHSSLEVLDLLSALFVAELTSPGRALWLVSPWISDLELVDNTAADFPALNRFGRRQIRLSEILAVLAEAGTRVVVATTNDRPKNGVFLTHLRTISADLGVTARVEIFIDPEGLLHTKALTGDDYALAGSMNITKSGVLFREEQVELRLETDYVASARMAAQERFGGVL